MGIPMENIEIRNKFKSDFKFLDRLPQAYRVIRLRKREVLELST
jgi:hypothetical protein